MRIDPDRIRSKVGAPPEGRFDDPPRGNIRAIRPAAPEPDTTSEMKPALTNAFLAVQARIQRGGGLAGAECGLTRLDYALDGWQRGRFYVIGGRTGMGKSIVGLNISMGLAAKGNGVDFLSLEMPTEEQATRALLCEARVPHYRIKNNTMQDEHWARMTAVVNDMCKWPWLWDDRGGVGTAWISDHVKRTRDRLGAKGGELHSVVIDHVQKIRGSNDRAPRREQMVCIVDDLKQLAKRESVCVIALAQIGRGTEARGLKDRRPRMADLQEAGAIEQEADTVALLYREDYYAEKREGWTNVLEVNLPKIRGGEPCKVKLRFDGARYRIDNLEENEP